MQIATRALAGLCLAAIVAAGPASIGAQHQKQPQNEGRSSTPRGDQPRSFWWKDAAVQKELSMTAQQAEKIESIWRASFPNLREMHKEMDALEKELSRLIRENTADEKLVALQVDRVEARRSVINKARTLTLYRMHRVLTPEQYEGLTRIQERRKQANAGRR